MKKWDLSIAGTLAVFIFLLTFSVSVQAFELGARGYYWFPKLSGDVRVDKNGVTGTYIDVENDLDISDESYPSVEVFLGVGKHHISLMYTDADYSGENNISRDIYFNGKLYTDTTFVASNLKFTMIDLEYQYDFLDLENVLAGFSLGIIAKVKYIEGETILKAASLGLDESETFTVPVPMLGLAMHMGILVDILEARVRVAGTGYSGNKFYEGLADVSLTPFPFLDVHGGYKYMKFEVDDISDVYTDIEFAGPYIGLTLSF